MALRTIIVAPEQSDLGVSVCVMNNLENPTLIYREMWGLQGIHYCLPPKGLGDILFFPESVRLSVCPSICHVFMFSCEPNSSYSFRLILFKLYTHFNISLKMCMWFFHSPEIIFFTYFCIFNLDFILPLTLLKCIWSRYLVSATPFTVSGWSFWNFTHILMQVWRCACDFFIILKLFFFTYFCNFNSDFFYF